MIAPGGSPTSAPYRRKPVQWERRLQKAIVQFHATCLVNPLDAILFAVPNGELRDPATAGMLSGRRRKIPGLPKLSDAELMRPAGLGVLPGVNDLVLLLRLAEVMLLEVKVPENEMHAAGRSSDEQKAYRRAVTALGHNYRLLESVEDYQRVLVEKQVPLRIVSLFPVQVEMPPPPPGLVIPTRFRRKRRISPK